MKESTGLSYNIGYFTQQRFLMDKTIKTYWRNPGYNFVHHIVNVVMAVLWGFKYWRAADIDEDF